METTKKTVYIKRNSLFRDFSMIMCNNITEIDESFIDDNMEIFYTECEECGGTGEVPTEASGNPNTDTMEYKQCDECSGEGQHTLEAYQYFIINASEYELSRLKEYGVRVGHSKLLDLDIMPIYDWGTGWSAFSYSKEVDADYQLSHDETFKRETVY